MKSYKTQTEGTIKVYEVAYHRNGVSGAGFHVVRFSQREMGNMVAIVFYSDDNHSSNGQCALLNTDLLAEENITFGENSWRGDRYERALRQAIRDYEDSIS